MTSTVPVTRCDVRLEPDPRRVIVKTFHPSGRDTHDGRTRVEHILDRVMAMSAADATRTLQDVRERFASRHPDLGVHAVSSFESLTRWIDDPASLSQDRRELVGLYFLHEYSIEAAALTNPSIVPAPDQVGVADGWLRVVVSLRGIGEGHISSIEFRTGLVGPAGEVQIEPPLDPTSGRRKEPEFDRALFTARLSELDVSEGVTGQLLGTLDDKFTMADLTSALPDLDAGPTHDHAIQSIHWLAASNYELTFPVDSAISQRVIFPAAPAESNGMEDARFVRFHGDDGDTTYFATYTAFDGFHVLPQLIETKDFAGFRIATMNGSAVRNKGIAIFTRRIGGRYAALGRADDENNFVMFSDHIRLWEESHRIQLPSRPWELVKIGNCGPPIETPAGWLVLTHGVGPMRTYALGAVLLDLDDPRRVLGHLHDPLLLPDENEREGYVPNVVYSCGSLIHGDRLFLAYGASDTTTCFATVPVDRLLDELTSTTPALTSRGRRAGITHA